MNFLIDYEFHLLGRILHLLNSDLYNITFQISASSDPESDGLLDIAEFLIGSGFVATQRFLNETRIYYSLSQEAAYDTAPFVNGSIAHARAIHAIANYWKHGSEWTDHEIEISSRKGPSTQTLEQISKLGDLGDYPCANGLAAMLPSAKLELSAMLPILSIWKDNLNSRSPCF